MAKLKHIAMSVPDPEGIADFYCQAFDMKRVGTTNSPLATGVYITDGVITLALLKYKTDKYAGYVKGEDERGKDFVGLHHIGFWVDDLKQAENQVEAAGGKYLMGRPDSDAPDTFYEEKYRDPNGVIFDISHLGWHGTNNVETSDEKVAANNKSPADA